MKRIYIAGKISGENLEHTIKKFGDYAYDIHKQGNEPINPIKLHTCNCEFGSCGMCNELGIIKREHSDYMKIDIAEMVTCHEIHMLPDWKDSKGATIEHDLAEKLGITIVYVK